MTTYDDFLLTVLANDAYNRGKFKNVKIGANNNVVGSATVRDGFGDELLNGEIFYTLKEAQILIKRWRQHYNTIRPHSSLGYQPPAPETVLPRPDGLSYTAFRSAHQGDHNRQTLT